MTTDTPTDDTAEEASTDEELEELERLLQEEEAQLEAELNKQAEQTEEANESLDRVPLDEIKEQTDAILTSFFDNALSMEIWYPKLEEETNVPTPETFLVELTNSSQAYLHMPETERNMILMDEDTQRKMDFFGTPLPSYEQICDAMEEQLNGTPVFLRSFYKSANTLGDEGTFINEASEQAIKQNLVTLFDSHIMQNMPHGKGVAFREKLDLEFYPDHLEREDTTGNTTFHPEVRFFVEDGEILYHFPRMNKDNFLNEFDNLDFYNKQVSKIEDDIEYLEPLAKEVAKAFAPHSWSVDFIQDTTGDWYCTDMAINAMYWNEKEHRWHNMSSHEDGNKHNLAETVGTTLPAPESPPNGFPAWRTPRIE